ncbi:MAG TPA: hypothetical protein VM686_38670 [Polyangiaceae bacterium]|nr:hypothetical protein [Polyangiaceae bacterium]
MRRFFFFFVLVASLVAGACKKAPPPPEVDSSLEQAMDLVASRCNVEVESAVVQCSGVEMGEIARGLVDGNQPRLGKLHTLVHSLSSPDAKRRVIAAHLARNVYGESFGPAAQPGPVSPQTADALIEALRKLPPALATRVAPVGAHAAALAGREEALFAALNGFPPEVRLEVYRGLMTYGRLAAFPKVRELAQGDFDQISAALASVSKMQNWSAEEQAAICPWLVGLTKHDNPRVVDQSYAVLQACKADDYQKLLRERQKR